MKIAVINPNSTVSMTEKIGEAAKIVASKGTVIRHSCPKDSPASIEGHYDAVQAMPGLLKELTVAEKWGADAYVIACFDDPAISACREKVTGPVVGICEASMRMAALIAPSFSVVTTLQRSVTIIEELAHHYGMDRYCRKVRAAEIPVLDLEHDGSAAKKKIKSEIMKAIKEDHCEAIILGCAGMADLTGDLTKECGLPVIDGVSCAVKLCEALVGGGLSTSKINSYAPPRQK